jgi:hypothetical protein
MALKEANESGRLSIDRAAETPGGNGKHPDLEGRRVVSFKDDTKTEDDQEGKQKIPAEGLAVPEKFTVSGH